MLWVGFFIAFTLKTIGALVAFAELLNFPVYSLLHTRSHAVELTETSTKGYYT